MTVPVEITESVQYAIDHAKRYERQRIIGMILKAFAEARSAGASEIADALDRLATAIEQSEPS